MATNKIQKKNTAIGVFYGLQENEKIETSYKEMYTLQEQITTLQRDHNIILTGDFKY